jgi:CRP-like cAMP-binding protein
MTQLEILAYAGKHFANLDEHDFALSVPYWREMEFKKGEIYNEQRSICKYMSFITEGVFRSYLIDAKTGDEKNIFLYSTNQFVVTFKSFINQVPCDYYTEALTDARVIGITLKDLLQLYRQSHKWEAFGRLVAQAAFNVAITRAESFMFKTPEERYLDVINQYPDIFNKIPLYHISSYLGIQAPSLSRIRKRLSRAKDINPG